MSSGPTRTSALSVAIAAGAASLVGCSDDPTPIPDLEVVDVQPLDLPPGDAYLSPDGGRIATYAHTQLCVYTTDAEKQLCADDPIVLDPNSIRWNPDGDRLLYTDPYRPYPYERQEPDVWSFDAESGEVTNLTDDGVDPADVTHRATPPEDVDGDFDVLPVWVDDSTIRFLRKDWSNEYTAAVMELPADGGEPEQVGTLETRYVPDTVTYTPDGRQAAYEAEYYTELSDLDGDVDTIADDQSFTTAFSPDGSKVLAVPRGVDDPRGTDDRVPTVVSVDDGHLKELYEPIRWATWQPDGDALAFARAEDAERFPLRIAGDVNEVGSNTGLLSERSFLPPHRDANLLSPVWSEQDTMLLMERTDEGPNGFRYVLVHLGQ
jgi:hypothetical protein